MTESDFPSFDTVMETKELTPLEQAERHVELYSISAENGRECVDGRYDQDNPQSGFLARPGGDFGYVMGLLALRQAGAINLSAKECVDAVYGAVTKDGGAFYMHSDNHARHTDHITGCGHIAKSLISDNPEYGVDPDDVEDALSYARDRSVHDDTDEIELIGEHKEKGVLVVRGMDKTIIHGNTEDMYFVYDADRDEAFQRQLVDDMDIPGLDVDNFKRTLDKQTQATLKLLAAGKPIFEVRYDSDKPEVSLTGYVDAA